MLDQRGWFDAWFNSGPKVQIVWCLVEGYNSMLGKKVWFDAGKKEMVWCLVKGYGLMLDRRGWFNAGLGWSLWCVQTRSTDDLWMSFVSHAHSLSLSLMLVHRSSVNLVCVVSPSLCIIVQYVEMRSTDHLRISSVCFSVLMAIFLSTSTDHLWMWLRKSSQTNFVCVDYFVLSQMNFVCDEEKHHKDGKSTQTTSTDCLWMTWVHTIRISLI